MTESRAEKRRELRSAGYRRAEGKKGRRPEVRAPQQVGPRERVAELRRTLKPDRKTKLVTPAAPTGSEVDARTGLVLPEGARAR